MSFLRSLEESALREGADEGRCFSIKLHDSGSLANRLLTVAMDRFGEDLAIGLRLIDIQSALRNEGGERVVFEMIPNSTLPLRGTTDLLPRVFNKESWGQLARLIIQVDQPEAEILVDERICLSPCGREGRHAGMHRVTIRKRGIAHGLKK